jgi:beta-glucosidase
MARAYVDGFQTSTGSDEIAGGWGYKSVNAMVKHWPSGGPEEGGRDAHYNYGKYAVYPGGAFETHLKPFTEGAFKLNGATGKASAVMPYYTISTGIDPSGKNVGNSYSKYIITDLLREKYAYDGVVCTD